MKTTHHFLFLVALFASVATAQTTNDSANETVTNTPAEQTVTGTHELVCASGEHKVSKLEQDVCVPDGTRPKVGATKQQVVDLLGSPNGSYQGDYWFYRNDASGNFELTFKHDKLVKITNFTQKPAGSGFGAKLNRAVGIAVDIAQRAALQNVCPQIYRKPVVFMNANELQWLQACNQNGFILFGAYILNH